MPCACWPGIHPVFFTGNQGREPLFIYLQAISIAAIGARPLALRLPAAFLGMLTISVTYVTFRALAGRVAGIVGAFLLATLYWHLSLSRLAFRAIGLPLFIALAVYFLHRGLRTNRFAFFAIGGFFLGVCLYTYIPSRLAIPLVGLWVLGFLIFRFWRNESLRRTLLGCAIALAVFLVAVLPIGRYFIAHPNDFMGRSNTAARALTVPSLLDGTEQALGGLFITGDPNARQDLPGHPLVDAATAVVGVIGLALAARRKQGAVTVLAIGWPVIMILPAALSYEPAHALRLSGELPLILLAPAIGYAWLLSRLSGVRRSSIRALPAAVGFVAGIALVGTAASTAWGYFVTWPSQPLTADVFQSDALHALNLIQQVPVGEPVMVTADNYQDQPIPLVFTPYDTPSVRAFDGRSNFVVPAGATTPIYYVFARTFAPIANVPVMPNLHPVAESHDQFGRVEGQLFRLDPPYEPPAPRREISAIIGGVRVVGADVSPTVTPGTHLIVALHWVVTGNPPPGQWEFLAHLVSRDHQRLIAQDYNHGFPPTQWHVGDQVISWFDLTVPDNAAATVADLDFGIFDPHTGQRLPVTQPNGAPAGNDVVVGPTRIDRPSPVAAPQHPLSLRLGSHVLLDGYDLTKRSDGSLVLQLHWHADGPVDHDYTVFAHRLDSQGKFLVAADAEPASGAFPTSTWTPAEEVLDTHILPANSAGSQIEFGMYLLATGQRLPVADLNSGKPGGDSVRIGN